MTHTLENLEGVANEARQAFEQQAVPKTLLRDLYMTLVPDLEKADATLNVIPEYFPEGNCGLATLYLQHVLQEGEIVTGKYRREPHVFLGLGRYIIDITADQFDGPPVYVGRLKWPWKKEATHHLKTY